MTALKEVAKGIFDVLRWPFVEAHIELRHVVTPPTKYQEAAYGRTLAPLCVDTTVTLFDRPAMERFIRETLLPYIQSNWSSTHLLRVERFDGEGGACVERREWFLQPWWTA